MKRIGFATLLIALTLAFSFKSSEPFIIVVDPGHGGKDAGYVSDQKGLSEKDITLNFTQRLIEISKAYPDLTIISTRNTDEFLDLKERVEIGNSTKPDLFISVHMDANKDLSKQGLRFMVSSKSKYKSESLALGEAIISRLQSEASLNIESSITDFDSYVLQNADCPALLLNIGHLSNSTDAAYMSMDDNIDALCKDFIEALPSRE